MKPSEEYPLQSTAEEAHATVTSSSHSLNTTPQSHHEDMKAKGCHGTNQDEQEAAVKELDSSITAREEAVVEETATTTTLQQQEEDGWCGREKLKRHRVQVAGRVWIPDTWGQEELLKDWIDCSAFDAALVSSGIMSARDALAAQQGLRTPCPQGLSIGNRC
ncbi:unnamed protein product [Linum trigynum]|uniref:Protein BIC1-like n=1 Tax=Linum trigynum TaxID=586398 RepID=A0AAV2F9Z5_9ROSI